MARDRTKGPRKIRVHLSAPGTPAEQAASIWVEETAPLAAGKFQVKLLHDYPDMKPAAGWTLLHDGRAYTVERVSGASLQCVAQAKASGGEEPDNFSVAGGGEK